MYARQQDFVEDVRKEYPRLVALSQLTTHEGREAKKILQDLAEERFDNYEYRTRS